MTTVVDVASYILLRKKQLTTMVLQKLCYYAQAAYLVKYSKPLFDEDFEAWRNGSVCCELFKLHRGKFFIYYEDLPIKRTGKDFTAKQLAVIDAVIDEYGDKTGQELSKKTHSETPWLNGRKGLDPFDFGDNVITKQQMREYYSKNPII